MSEETDPAKIAQTDQILAGATDMATAWAKLYHSLIAEGMPVPYAVRVVEAYVNGIARSTRQDS